VKTFNAVKQRLAQALADKDAPPFLYDDLKREHLMRTVSPAPAAPPRGGHHEVGAGLRDGTMSRSRFGPLLAMARAVAAVASCGAVALAAAASEHPSGPVLTPIVDVPLPGDTSRFDYESYDPSRHLLFIAHLGQSEVLAFDTRAQRVVGSIGGLRHVHGVLAIPELGLVYATATGSNEVVAIDEERLREVARMPGGTYPDGMAYAPRAGRLFVSDETGGTETVIDVRSNRRVVTIALGGEVGNTQYDPASGHIFVNVQSRRQLAEIDPATDQIVGRFDLPGARGNHGLLIAPDLRLAFIGCEDNDTMLVFDLTSRQVVASYTVGSEPDVLAYDAALGLLYVASESGTLSVFQAAGRSVDKLAEERIGPKAHVVAVDPDTHLVYLPVQNAGGRAVLRIMRPAQSAFPPPK
jgi:DNA-binding beta-propeller fold protein YncE